MECSTPPAGSNRFVTTDRGRAQLAETPFHETVTSKLRMPPPVASALCALFILWLFTRELQLSPKVSHALWIPWVWITLIGSRFPSVWLAGSETMSSADAYLEGSSLDRNVFLGLII